MGLSSDRDGRHWAVQNIQRVAGCKLRDCEQSRNSRRQSTFPRPTISELMLCNLIGFVKSVVVHKNDDKSRDIWELAAGGVSHLAKKDTRCPFTDVSVLSQWCDAVAGNILNDGTDNSARNPAIDLHGKHGRKLDYTCSVHDGLKSLSPSNCPCPSA